MSGELRKDEIIQEKEIIEALKNIASAVQPIVEGFKQLTIEGDKMAKSIGGTKNLKDIVQISKLQAQAAANLAREKKALIDVENKVLQQMKLEAQVRDNELRVIKRQLELLVKEQQVKQSKIATDTKVVNQMKAEQDLINKETQARIKNNQLIVSEERAKQSKIRTDRLEQQSTEKTVKSKRGLATVFNGLIKSIGVYAAAMFALNRIVQFFTRDLLDMTKKLDSLDFSMKTVLKSQEEFAETQLFLRDTAVAYGQDILTLTERYIKFRAAAQQSNMTVRDTMQIFNSTAKAASVLGLKTDEVNGVFLALEQMISKGKVTTEELRRQLGERLPGAFGIMADAMGVPISQLDKMLKAGEIISTEALPKFAIALEEAYGIKAVETVDTLAAAQGRLRTSWVQFVQALEAGDTYKSVLNFLSQAIIQADLVLNNLSLVYTRTSQLTQDQVTRSFDFLLRLNSRKAREFQVVIQKYGDASVEHLKENAKQIVTEINEVYRISMHDALLLYSELVRRTENQFNEIEKRQITPFDLNAFKETIDSAEEEYKSLGIIQDAELKRQAVESAAFYKDNQQTYKEFIQNQIKQLESQTKAAENLYIIEQSMYDDTITAGKEVTKEQRQNLQTRLTNYQNYVQASILLRQKLEEKGTGTKKDDSLKRQQERQKAELEAVKQGQQRLLQNDELTEDQRRQAEFDNEQELLQMQMRFIDENLKLVEKGSLDELKLITDKAELRTKIEENLTDRLIDEEKIRQKRLEEQRKKDRDSEIAGLIEIANEQRVQLTKRYSDELAERRNKKAAVRALEIKEGIELLQIEYKYQQGIIDSQIQTDEKKEEARQKQKELEERLYVFQRDGTIEVENIKRQQIQDTLSFIGESAGQAFSALSNIYAGQLQGIEDQYKMEVALAGNSAEERILAERKYDKEKAKIQRKQAIAEKAQTALSIALNTAAAIISIWAQVPKFDFGISAGALTAIVASLGAAQLATVLAQKIPAFEKGTDSAPSTFIAGEKGSEAIITPKGGVMLTPNKATLYDDKSLIGSTILPHDETQRMLANYAVNHTYDMVDMTDTNKHLRKLVRNTSSSDQVRVEGKYRIVKRGSITTKYAIS
jgi:tape measure domain-containing protein